jgi:hypothetical protein
MGNSSHAERIYELLLPYVGDFTVQSGGLVGRCPTSHYLGLMAAMMARHEDAELHFEDALAKSRALAAPPWIAQTQYHYAKMLQARGGAGDRERARALAGEALRTAEAIGLRKLADDARALLAAGGAPFDASSASENVVRADGVRVEPPRKTPEAVASSRLCRDGGHWTISHEGVIFRLKDSKGLRTISHLLSHPGLEFHVMDLVAVAEEANGSHAANDTVAAAARGLRVGGLGDAGELLDPRAKAAYRTRLEDLRAELEEGAVERRRSRRKDERGDRLLDRGALEGGGPRRPRPQGRRSDRARTVQRDPRDPRCPRQDCRAEPRAPRPPFGHHPHRDVLQL